MKKTVVRTGLIVALAVSLAACGGKKGDSTAATSDIETSVEETKDPFAIGDGSGVEVETKAETQVAEVETTSPEETRVVEITETDSNGLSTGVLANGDGFIEMNVPGALANNGSTAREVLDGDPEAQGAQGANEYEINQNNQMSEEEYVSYDAVVSYWSSHPDLSEEYLEEMFNSGERFPSLSDFQRRNFINEIKATYPHNPAETKAYDTYWDTNE